MTSPLLQPVQVAFDDVTQHETPCTRTHGVGGVGGTPLKAKEAPTR